MEVTNRLDNDDLCLRCDTVSLGSRLPTLQSKIMPSVYSATNQRLVTVIPIFGMVIYIMQAVLTGPEMNTKTQVKKHIYHTGTCAYGYARTHTAPFFH
jgi:hypothetical protein